MKKSIYFFLLFFSCHVFAERRYYDPAFLDYAEKQIGRRMAYEVSYRGSPIFSMEYKDDVLHLFNTYKLVETLWV